MTFAQPNHAVDSPVPSVAAEGVPLRLKEAPSGLALLLQGTSELTPMRGPALLTSASASSAHLLELAGASLPQALVDQVLGIIDSNRQQWHQFSINFPVLRQQLQIILDAEKFPEDLHEKGSEWAFPLDLQSLGRLGNSEAVYMDMKSASGDCKFDSTELRLESQSNFSSLRTAACVFKGKWMYEATLVTAGIQQIGWATLRCPFTNEEGVGDAPDSFAYDGKRVRKWNVSCQQYGQPWVSGDVVGCCIDLDKGEVLFLRNGTSLGVAYTGVKRLSPGAAYFPAVSLSHGEACELNFGARPLMYPVPGFRPMQPPPRVRAKRTVLIPPVQKPVFNSPGASSPFSPATTPTVASEAGATGPFAVPMPKQPLNAASPPPLELPFSSVPDNTWEGPVDMDSESLQPLPNLTPVSSPKDVENLFSVKTVSKPLVLPELLASPRAKYLLKCLQRLLEFQPPSARANGRTPVLRPHDTLLCASLLLEKLAPLLLATVPSHPPKVKPQRLKQPKQAPTVSYYVIWDALVPWLVHLAQSNFHTLEKALEMLVLCLEPHELGLVVPEVMAALSYKCRTAVLLDEGLPHGNGYWCLKLACALAARCDVLNYWWHSWGFEESLEGLLTKKALNKNDLAVLLPQVWWPTYREKPGTEAAFKADTAALMAAVDSTEELQVRLCRCLLNFTPSSSPMDGSVLSAGTSDKVDGGKAVQAVLGALSGKAEPRMEDRGTSDRPGQSSGSAGASAGPLEGAQSESNSDRATQQRGGGIWMTGWDVAEADRRAGPEGGASTSTGGGDATTGSAKTRKGPGCLIGQTAFPTRKSMAKGAAFKHFLLWLLRKNRGVHRNVPPPGLSDNSVLVSVYFALLRILKDGSDAGGSGGEWETEQSGLLSGRGVRRFPVSLFLKSDGHYADLSRLGGLYSHLIKEVPWSMEDGREVAWAQRSGEVFTVGEEPQEQPPEEGTASSDGMEIDGQEDRQAGCRSGASTARADGSTADADVRTALFVKPEKAAEDAASRRDAPLVSAVCDSELLDILVVLYNLGIASNFKQASHFLQNQMHHIAQLDETDLQLAAARPEQENTLREVRMVFVDDVAENARWSAWSRATLSSPWKQEAMYAACAWIVQMLLAVSSRGSVFGYVPEVYVESLVDSFHAIRRSDPPFVPPQSLLQDGLPPLVTFLATHFTDARIANPDVRDVLLQSISVLLNYKEYVAAFERSRAARESLIPALLRSFDNRFWIPVSNILLRMCKGAGFGASRQSHAGLESPVFQGLIKDTFACDGALASSFLNKLFNMLNWTVTEFSVAMKEMQDLLARRQVPELQQRKCAIMFELSCNLERILEFLAQELPQLFLAGPEMNLSRLCELVTFVLNHTTAGPDAGLFDSTLRLQMQSLEKISRPMILAPLIGIVINLAAAPARHPDLQHDIVRALAAADASSESSANFDYLLDFNWSDSFKGDPSLPRVSELKGFVKRYKQELEALRQRDADEKDRRAAAKGKTLDDSVAASADGEQMDEDGSLCPICYAFEIDTVFEPCLHESCKRCISRHLLNNKRCFFCNAEVTELIAK